MPVEGETFEAELSAVDQQWRLTFNTGKLPTVIPAEQLVRWGSCAEAGRGPLLVLTDGGMLVAEVLVVDQEKCLADADLFGLVTLPLESVAGVIVHVPSERTAADQLIDRIQSAEGQRDLVMLANGDRLLGHLQALEAGVMKLETDVGPLEVEIHRTTAIVFNPALSRTPEYAGVHAVAGFADGSRLVADQLLFSRAEDSLEITTAHLAGSTSAGQLVFVMPLGAGVTYLSELEPSGYRHVPYLTLPWNYRIDRNVIGSMLRCGGELYLKGLGVHSAARLTYRLDGSFRLFQARLGIDDAAGQGSARFHVLVDGRPLYKSPIVRGGSPPLPISVDVAGGKRLDLLVDYADRADQRDYADWLEARLVK